MDADEYEERKILSIANKTTEVFQIKLCSLQERERERERERHWPMTLNEEDSIFSLYGYQCRKLYR